MSNLYFHASDWIQAQPDWVQNVLVGLLLAVLGGLGTGIWQLAKYVRGTLDRLRRRPLPLESGQAQALPPPGFAVLIRCDGATSTRNVIRVDVLVINRSRSHAVSLTFELGTPEAKQYWGFLDGASLAPPENLLLKPHEQFKGVLTFFPAYPARLPDEKDVAMDWGRLVLSVHDDVSGRNCSFELPGESNWTRESAVKEAAGYPTLEEQHQRFVQRIREKELTRSIERLAAKLPSADVSGAAVSSKDWLDQGERFRRFGNLVQAIWTRDVDSQRTTWNVTPKPGASVGDAEAFIAEAALAGKLLIRAGLSASKDPADCWLDAMASLTRPDSDVELTSTQGGVVVANGGEVTDPPSRSARTCALLAVDAPPNRT